MPISSPTEPALDDYLGLLTQPLQGLRLLLFHGESGSGKSSQIRLLIESHPALRDRELQTLNAQQTPAVADITVIEELRGWADTRVLTPALRRSRLLLVASHVEPRWLWPWRLRVRHRCFRLDARIDKLVRWLRQRNIMFSDAALRAFVARYGANYTDLEIVLDHAPGAAGTPPVSFDAAWAVFCRGTRIDRGALPR